MEESRCLCCLPCLPCLPVCVLPGLRVARRGSYEFSCLFTSVSPPEKVSLKFSRLKWSHRSPMSLPKGCILAALTKTKPTPVKYFYLDEF